MPKTKKARTYVQAFYNFFAITLFFIL